MVTNGSIPTSQMVQRQGLWGWPSTATKFDIMDYYLTSRGYEPIVISKPYGFYRSYADQVEVKKIYGPAAATPGYSNHGLGKAFDIWNISNYPDSVIAAAGAAAGLTRDAYPGGKLETWHMHDASGIVPAGWTGTPILTAITKEESMSYSLVPLANSDLVVILSLDTGNYSGIQSQYHVQLLTRAKKNDGSDEMLPAELDIVRGYLKAVNPPVVVAASAPAVVDINALAQALKPLLPVFTPAPTEFTISGKATS